jgi:hypothetical protein
LIIYFFNTNIFSQISHTACCYSLYTNMYTLSFGLLDLKQVTRWMEFVQLTMLFIYMYFIKFYCR